MRTMFCGRRLAAKSAGLHPVHRRFESCRPHQNQRRSSSGRKSACPVRRKSAVRIRFSAPVRSSVVGSKRSIDNREIRSSILLSATSSASSATGRGSWGLQGVAGERRWSQRSIQESVQFRDLRMICELHNFPTQSMDDHHRALRVAQHALRVRAQHPSMKDRVATLAHDNETCLDRICPVDDLFRRMAQDDVCFEINVLLSGALAERGEAALIPLTPVFKNRIELRAFGRFRRPDYREDEQLGFHISCHRQGNIQCVLCMRRSIVCNKNPLNPNKYRASHGDHLTFFCGYWPLNCMLWLRAFQFLGKKMPGKKERVCNHGWNHRTGDHGANNIGVLRLRDDLMIEAK